jgi:hypothetical protein
VEISLSFIATGVVSTSGNFHLFHFWYHSLDRAEDRAVAMDRVGDMEKDAHGLKVSLARRRG